MVVNSKPRVAVKILKSEAERKLRLPRITHANAEKAAEIEQRRRAERIQIVGVVEGVKYLDARDERQPPIVEMDRASHAEIKNKERIVFSEVISPAVDTIHEPGCRIVEAARGSSPRPVGVVSFGLGGVLLNAEVAVDTKREIAHSVGVEFVALIAIGERIFCLQIVEVGVTEREGIALV